MRQRRDFLRDIMPLAPPAPMSPHDTCAGTRGPTGGNTIPTKVRLPWPLWPAAPVAVVVAVVAAVAAVMTQLGKHHSRTRTWSSQRHCHWEGRRPRQGSEGCCSTWLSCGA